MIKKQTNKGPNIENICRTRLKHFEFQQVPIVRALSKKGEFNKEINNWPGKRSYSCRGKVLYEKERDRIIDLTHSQYAIKALDFLFIRPIFQTSAFVFEADIPEHTAEKMIKKLRDSGLFRVLRQAKGRESAVVAFRDVLNITEGSEVF